MNNGTRQLACIMFTDIVGYTALMGEDEHEAFEALQINRKIQKPIIEKYGGIWIKELGDGVLATFASVTDAVQAAAAIQVVTQNETDYKLRIGLHLSEVVFENGDVFGDGVNIAARIQALAEIGGILISETVQKNLTNKRGIETHLVGQEKLKNVKQDVIIYKVEFDPAYFDKNLPEQKTESKTQTGKSIAVMPFLNLNKEEDQDYFSEGIAEEIIVTLSGIKNLKVVGRRSSFQFKGGNVPVSEIGKMLNVNTILEGSVRRHGNGLRIYAELINIEDGCQLWAEKYDREITDMYIIQDDIANNIAEQLKVTFSDQESKSLPVNLEAYEFLLKGRYYAEKFIEGFDKALVCFNRAIEIDPNYGHAYSELSKLYFLSTMMLVYTPQDGFERAKFYAEKALSIDAELGSAHYVFGQIYFWYHWDIEKAKHEFELAAKSKVSYFFTGVVLDPWYYAFGKGDFDTAINSMNKILTTDPLSFFAYLNLALLLTFGKMPKQEREVLNKMLAAMPEYSEAERLIGNNYFFENDLDNALVHARKAAAMSNGIGWAQNSLIIILAKRGDHEEARKLLKVYENQKAPMYSSPLGVAIIYAHLGELDTAFEYLNKAVDYHDIWIMSLKYSPDYELFRKDERFQTILERVGFPRDEPSTFN